MVTIAVVPARSGSKRIPKKNVVDFLGRPLLSWAIDAAVKSKSIDAVIISTDDREIENVAVAAGAQSFGLRDRFADDEAPSSLVSLFEMQRYSQSTGLDVETVVQLLPTCPLRSSVVVETVVRAHRAEPERPRLSAHAVAGGNVWWAATLEATGEPTFLNPDAVGTRSQDLADVYLPNGAVWAIQGRQLQEYQTFYAPGFVFHPISWIAGFDIDTPEELEFARSLGRGIGLDPA